MGHGFMSQVDAVELNTAGKPLRMRIDKRLATLSSVYLFYSLFYSSLKILRLAVEFGIVKGKLGSQTAHFCTVSRGPTIYNIKQCRCKECR